MMLHTKYQGSLTLVSDKTTFSCFPYIIQCDPCGGAIYSISRDATQSLGLGCEKVIQERSGSVVECFTRDRRTAGTLILA